MIGRAAFIAVWLLVGAAVIAGLYWAFLNTPESNALVLTVSALLLLLMVAVGATVVNAAVLVALGRTFRESIEGGARRIGWFLVVAVPVALITWAVLRGDQWVTQRSGEISAWFIARFGWADMTPLFRTQSYLSIWIRWVLLPVTTIAALAGILQHGSLAPRHWLRGAWHWRPLLIATIAFLVLIALPWRAAFWRPASLPPTWVEPAFAGLRLGLIAIAAAMGASIMLVAGTWRAARDPGHVR